MTTLPERGESIERVVAMLDLALPGANPFRASSRTRCTARTP